ncbi:transposase, partial [Cohnella zeiphila]|nr:transposase [Cohnella zeiphila]MBB6732567.1 transposase [Cohnella zeiphila]
MGMFDGSLSFDQVQRLLQDEEACIRVLFDARWPDGFRCPRCGRSSYSLISTRSLPLYECSRCRKQTSLIAGTVFQGTRTPLRLWFQAIYLHSRPGGVNALQLSEEIGVTYKTAWSICHKLRHAMSHAEAGELLEGWVRIQDAAIIHRATPTLEWQPQEQSVLIGAS